MEEFKIPATMKAMTLVAYDQLKLAEGSGAGTRTWGGFMPD